MSIFFPTDFENKIISLKSIPDLLIEQRVISLVVLSSSQLSWPFHGLLVILVTLFLTEQVYSLFIAGKQPQMVVLLLRETCARKLNIDWHVYETDKLQNNVGFSV